MSIHNFKKKTIWFWGVQVSNFEFPGVLRSSRVAPHLNELLHFGNACGTAHQDDLIHLVLLQSWIFQDLHSTPIHIEPISKKNETNIYWILRKRRNTFFAMNPLKKKLIKKMKKNISIQKNDLYKLQTTHLTKNLIIIDQHEVKPPPASQVPRCSWRDLRSTLQIVPGSKSRRNPCHRTGLRFPNGPTQRGTEHPWAYTNILSQEVDVASFLQMSPCIGFLIGGLLLLLLRYRFLTQGWAR